MTSELRYPIGPFAPVDASPDVRRRAVTEIAVLPKQLAAAVAGLNDRQLDTPYRPGGWTVRQVVHHLADSHMNALIRCKQALTEQQPRVSAYDEKKFAELSDARLPIAISQQLIDSVHARWVSLYEAMADADWSRTFDHPEYPSPLTLDWQAQMYGWHSRHHVAHITALRKREGW